MTRDPIIMTFLYCLLFFPFLPFIFVLLFESSNYIVNIIMTIMFINITVIGILVKSNGVEFQVRNSSGMFCPYLSD